MSRTADYLTELAEDAGVVAELEALTAYAAYVGSAEYAVDTFEDAYEGEWSTLEDFAHDQLMETDAEYRAAMESCRGWRPSLDMVAWECDYTHTASGHVFRSV
ncbi:antirestriction protein ArdA [Kitasatospora sp. MBT66]|uniref:antirestriction protein ArdA n=1 Tax=Kitasatospora sp. MBT66 TaxID=1444769 RepID=UPI0005BD62B3|nr:antirestriction protein ArdA [Kitasatospora sp. MBT66]